MLKSFRISDRQREVGPWSWRRPNGSIDSGAVARALSSVRRPPALGVGRRLTLDSSKRIEVIADSEDQMYVTLRLPSKQLLTFHLLHN